MDDLSAIKRLKRLRRVTALLIVILLLTGAIYIVLQVNLSARDVDMEDVDKPGSATDLNLAQSINGVQVQLNWAYIDERRAILNYETFLLDGDGSRNLADADAPTIIRLIERSGYLPDLYLHHFNARHYPKPVTVEFYLPQYRPSLKGIAGPIDLRLEIVYTERPRTRNAIEKLLFPKPRTLHDWGPPESHEPLPPESLSFALDFTLPVPQAVIREPMLTITASDVAMQLESIRVSPSQIDFTLRYQLPPGDERYWDMENIMLEVDDVQTGFMGGGETSHRGNGLVFHRGYFNVDIEPPETVKLTVDALGRRLSENAAAELLAIQSEMAARGIDMWVDIKSDGQVGGFSWPASTAEERAVLVDLGYRIEGPWVFTIDVHAP